MKSLFKLIVYIRKSLFFNFKTSNVTFNNVSWVRELSQGKNPREIPSDAEHAEVTQMLRELIRRE